MLFIIFMPLFYFTSKMQKFGSNTEQNKNCFYSITLAIYLSYAGVILTRGLLINFKLWYSNPNCIFMWIRTRQVKCDGSESLVECILKSLDNLTHLLYLSHFSFVNFMVNKCINTDDIG